MRTTTIKEAKAAFLGQSYRFSLQNLTQETEHLSHDLDELTAFLKANTSTDDFLFWDNQENDDIYVQFED